MSLKLLLMKKGMTQTELSKKLKVNPAMLSQQINLHRILPEKHLEGFCKAIGITRKDLEKAMKGGSYE